ncbi:MAG: inositol monophosphatase, monophosphatase [Candidatus Saccharibacteria bacterium]|nr:inositol monophosphatase, monophosphatase [Candidatus Saccharibacteria bacterium]
MDNLDEYIKNAEAAILAVLKEWHPRLMEHFGENNYSLKADKTVVTELDKSLEIELKDALKILNPKVGYLGEEHGQEGPKDIFWLVDPIDGTELYIRGLDGCRTLLCLIVNDEPVYAFAYRFVKGDLFTAQKGKGMFHDGVQVHIKPRVLNRLWVEVSIDMNNEETMAAIVRIAKNVNAVLYTKEFLRIFEGFADAHIAASLGGPWDYTPRALFMQEAGARISNIGSETYDYKNPTLLAAHPDVFDDLKNLLSPQA